MKHLHAFYAVSLFMISGLCETVAQELHTHNNAVSINNEANSTSGWSGNATLTADTADPKNGVYALKVVSTGSGSTSRRTEYTYSAMVGETYNISIWAKTGAQTGDPAFASWTGVTGFNNPTLISTDGNWAEYTFTVTATSSNPLILIYTGSSGGGAIGDELYIDQVSISRQSSSDTQAPTAPILSSLGHTDTTVNLAWNGATDNVGITGYNIYRDGIQEASPTNSPYTVTGLTAATTYSFTVTALDAAGNESVISNVVSVTTDSSSGGGGGSSVWSESGSTASYTGDVAIGTNSVPSGYKLAVDGHIRTREIRVDQDTWPDYVFKEGYDLPSLEEIKIFIDENGHLPNIPTAQEVETHGMDVGQMNKLLLEKIEEGTLHNISQEKLIQFQKNQILQLMEKVFDQEIRIKKLEDIIKNIDHE